MSYFKAKIQRNEFRLGSTPDALGELTELTGPLYGFKEPTSKPGEGKGKNGSGRPSLL